MGYKRYGFIVYDTDSRSIKGLHFPTILDLVEDKVRNRLYSISILLLVWMFVAYIVIGPAFRGALQDYNKYLPVSEIVVLNSPTMSFSFYFGDHLIPFSVRVVNQLGDGLEGREVKLSAIVGEHVGTLGFPTGYPAQWVYDPVLSGDLVATTNRFGVALFYNLSFLNGVSSVVYNLVLECEGIVNQDLEIYLSSKVSYGSVLDQNLNSVIAQIGQPFSLPSIQFFTVDMEPAAHAQVAISVIPDPNFGAISYKYAVLTDNIAYTDENGIFNMSNIKILGSNVPSQGILIIIEGRVFPLQTTSMDITILSPVAHVDVVQPPPTRIGEGETFPQKSPTILVRDASGNPLPNRIVFAMLSVQSGLQAVDGTSILFQPKQLDNSTSTITNSDGIATFENLGFAKFGNAGQFAIYFVCDGVGSTSSYPIYVTPSVSRVSIEAAPHSVTIYSSAYSVLSPIPIVRAMDKNNGGLPFHWIEARLLENTGYLYNYYQQSDSIGYATFADLYFTAAEAGTYHMVFSCDGVDSEPIEIVVSHDDIHSSSLCAGVTVTNGFPTQIPVGDYFPSLNVKVVDYKNRPMGGKIVVPQTTSGLPMETDMYGDYFSNYGAMLNEVYATSDISGIAQFSGSNALHFNGGYNLSMSVVFVAGTYDSNGFHPECQSQKYILNILNPINAASLSYAGDSRPDTLHFVEPGAVLDVSIKLSLYPGKTVPADLYPEIYVNYGDPFDMYAANGTIDNFFVGSGTQVSEASKTVGVEAFYGYKSPIACQPNGICGFGDISISLAHPGIFYLIARVAGVMTNSIITVTLTTVANITVTTYPYGNSSDVVYIDQPFAVQPAVRVTNDNGAPVPGIRVAAISMDSNGNFSGALQRGQNRANPVAVADENGIATFTDLYFSAGPSQPYIVAFFHQAAGLYYISEFTQLELINDVAHVRVITPPTATAAQGVRLATPSTVLVTDENGFPIPNRVVTATLPPSAAAAAAIYADGSYAITSSDGIAIFNSLMFSPAYSGVYDVIFSASGVKSGPSKVLVTDQPTKLTILNGNNEIPSLEVRRVILIEVQATIASGSELPNIRVDAVLDTETGNAQLDNSKTTEMTNAAGIASFELTFVSGISGLYIIHFKAGGITSNSLTINVTNLVSTITFSRLPSYSITSPLLTLRGSLTPTVAAYKADGTPLAGRDVEIRVISDDRIVEGSIIGYDPSTTTDSSGEYKFKSIFFRGGAASGFYQLQFLVDGVESALSNPFYLSNPAQPNMDQLSLHEAQNYFLVLLLCVIPLFIGNSSVQPTWQLLVTIPFLVVLVVLVLLATLDDLVSNSEKFRYGTVFIIQASLFVAMALIVILMYIVMSVRTIQGLLIKKRLDYRQNKLDAYREYVKAHLPFGSKQFFEKVAKEKREAQQKVLDNYTEFATLQKDRVDRLKEADRKQNLSWIMWFYEGVRDFILNAFHEIKHDIIHIKHLFVHKKKKKEKVIGPKKVFYYPQRIWLAFALSLLSAFLALLACVLLTLYVHGKLMKVHDEFLIAYEIEAAIQPQNLINNANSLLNSTLPLPIPSQYADQLASLLAQAGPSIPELIVQQLPINLTIDFLNKVEGFGSFIGEWASNIYTAGIASCIISYCILLLLWLCVFLKYKVRLLDMRRGKYFFDKKKVTLIPAATYIGLQAVHAVTGFLMLWGGLTVSLSLFMYAPFRHLLAAQQGLIISFLLGVPFVTKTITKLVISHWIVEQHTVIKHRRLWAFFDFVWIFVNLIAVIAMSLVRFAVALGVAFVNFMRMDHSILPFKGYELIDFGYSAYVGMMLLDHEYNNPIFATFSQTLIAEMKDVRKYRKSVILHSPQLKGKLFGSSVEDGQQLQAIQAMKTHTLRRRQIAARWWLTTLLLTNPQLREYRKHYPSKEEYTRHQLQLQEESLESSPTLSSSTSSLLPPKYKVIGSSISNKV